MWKLKRPILALFWTFLLAACITQPILAQSGSAALSEDALATLQQQNNAFIKATSDAAPALKRRLAVQEANLTSLLEQVSTAEKNKDMALAEKLSVQLGDVDADITRLHMAQVDFSKLRNVSAMISKNLSSENPSGQICNGGSCAGVPAFEAIIVILTAGLADELNKKQPFGPNNEIMKGLHAIGDFVQCIFGCK